MRNLTEYTFNIAIVGGGIGGTASAYFLKSLLGKKVNLALYEPFQIGGRLSTANLLGEEYENGGAIIHPKNQYMVHFLEKFNLRKKVECPDVFGIFNGSKWLFRGSQWNWVSNAKLLWKYGFDLIKLEWKVSDMLSKFSRIYKLQEEGHYFRNLSDMLASMDRNFVHMTQVSFGEYLKSQGFKDSIVDELVSCATRTNYGQMPVDMHAFVGSVALAGGGGGLWSVEGGNKQIPQHLLESSGAVHEKEVVTAVIRDIDGKFTLESSVTKNSGQFDAVILAIPLIENETQLRIVDANGEILDGVKKFPYKNITCTLVRGVLNRKYFGNGNEDNKIEMDTILTNEKSLWFNSVGLQHATKSKTCLPLTPVYKVFSASPLTHSQLSLIFESWDASDVKNWKAYPKYSTEAQNRVGEFQVLPGLYYNNAIEVGASAMEMSAISAMNSALLVRQYLREEKSLDSLPSKLNKDEL